MISELSDSFQRERMRMVEEQILRKGAFSPNLIKALQKIPRHLFVSNELKKMAYEDSPLPIGLDQTISQPYIVALMTEALGLKKNHRVLEVGTGSGYQTAILTELTKLVYSIEIREEFSLRVVSLFNDLGIEGANLKIGDGSLGWEDEAPFDRIIVTAAPKKVPEALLNQLAPSGKMVIPLGGHFQNLFLFEKNSRGELTQKLLLPVVFVPMASGQIHRR